MWRQIGRAVGAFDSPDGDFHQAVGAILLGRRDVLRALGEFDDPADDFDHQQEDGEGDDEEADQVGEELSEVDAANLPARVAGLAVFLCAEDGKDGEEDVFDE